jgi:hypothetical protein
MLFLSGRFNGVGKEGTEYILNNSESEPIFGYQGLRHTKLYRPHSNFRSCILRGENGALCVRTGTAPAAGDILFITGGKKDVLSLVSHGFHAVCLNSETAQIRKTCCGASDTVSTHAPCCMMLDEARINQWPDWSGNTRISD